MSHLLDYMGMHRHTPGGAWVNIAGPNYPYRLYTTSVVTMEGRLAADYRSRDFVFSPAGDDSIGRFRQVPSLLGAFSHLEKLYYDLPGSVDHVHYLQATSPQGLGDSANGISTFDEYMPEDLVLLTLFVELDVQVFLNAQALASSCMKGP